MKEKCTILGTCCLVLGIIGSVGLAYRYGVELDYQYSEYSFDAERDWLLTAVIFAGGVFGSYVIYMIFQALAAIFEGLQIIRSEMDLNKNEMKEQLQDVLKLEQQGEYNAQGLYDDLPEL